MDRASFDIYGEAQLAPALLPGAVMILDNLSTQEPGISRDPQGARLLVSVPAPHPSDLSPIEMAFSKVKAYSRRLGPSTYDRFVEALGDACGLFDSDACRNFFKAVEYAPR